MSHTFHCFGSIFYALQCLKSCGVKWYAICLICVVPVEWVNIYMICNQSSKIETENKLRVVVGGCEVRSVDIQCEKGFEWVANRS